MLDGRKEQVASKRETDSETGRFLAPVGFVTRVQVIFDAPQPRNQETLAGEDDHDLVGRRSSLAVASKCYQTIRRV